MMIALKLAREAFTPKRDNILDICGYAACHDLVVEEKKRRLLQKGALPSQKEWYTDKELAQRIQNKIAVEDIKPRQVSNGDSEC